MIKIGIDLGGTKTEMIVLDEEKGDVLARERVATPKGDYEKTVMNIVELVKTAEEKFNDQATVGVGIPGTVSAQTGLVKNANSTWIIGKPLQKDLAAALDRPVRVENDANCFAVSEAVDGAARGAKAVFGVILGTGVGAGIVIDGNPLVGINAIGGEWGHNPLPWPNVDEVATAPSCYCGRKGCIETYLSGPSFARDYQKETGQELTAPEIIARVEERKDKAAMIVFDRYVDRLARGLAHIINVLDPDVIVLGGGMSNIEMLYEKVPAQWGQYIFSDTVLTKLVPPQHGDSSGVRGAAWLW